MSLVALIVLQDCKIALKLIENEDDSDIWRVHWAGAVALLRAVGHVLHKVDSVEHPDLKQTIEAQFRVWNSDSSEHQIFRDFIDQERNSILKEYTSSAHDGGLLPILIEQFPMTSDGDAQEKFESLDWLSQDIFRPRMQGYRAGDDVRDIYSDAIDWWQTELTKILAR